MLDTDKIDDIARAVSTGMAAQEATLEMAKKLAETTDDFGKSANRLLNATKGAGAVGGLVSAGTAIYDAYHNHTPGNLAKAVGNSLLVVIKVHPVIGIVTGILDATGVSNKIYDSIGNYVNDNITIQP